MKPHNAHRQTYAPGYKTWVAMMARCNRPEDKDYKNYGGRGISVCNEWKNPSAYCEWFTEHYMEGMTVDRIEVNGDYSPENCRFATAKTQGRNRRNTILDEEKVKIIRSLFLDGTKQGDISRIMGVSRKCIYEVVRNKTWT